jgi:hypothetical protein
MRYSIVRTTLSAVESPNDEQVRLIESEPMTGSTRWQRQQAYFGYLRQHNYWMYPL